MTYDAISDLLIRIKNGYMASAEKVEMPQGRVKEAVVAVLKQEGFIDEFTSKDGTLTVVLKYQGKSPAMENVTRIS